MSTPNALSSFHNEPPDVSSRARIALVDRLRGWVILWMALDHARGFLQPAGVSPEDLTTTTIPFFLMRWITHLCAPTFVLLAGVSCWLVARGRDLPPIRSHLLKRGLVLMALEVTWISFSWSFGFQATYLGVLWAIGGSLVLLSFLVGRSPAVVGGLGVGLTLLFASADVASWHPVLDALCRPQRFELYGHPIHSFYLIGPWFGVMAIGYGLAPWFERTDIHTRLTALGAALLVGFLSLRGMNGWGDPTPWATQDGEAWRTAFDFLNPSKYPPSLLFLLMTLGLVFLCAPALSKMKGPLASMLDACGKTALFFYLLHIPLLHGAAWCVSQLTYGASRPPEGEPISYLWICGAWIGVCVLLTPVCRRWRALKKKHGTSQPWMRYL